MDTSKPKHYVSPKQAGGYVVLELAGGQFDFSKQQLYGAPADGTTVPCIGVSSYNPTTKVTTASIQVPRDVAGRYVVSVVDQTTHQTVTGSPVMNVWIVWADGRIKTPHPPAEGYNYRDEVKLMSDDVMLGTWFSPQSNSSTLAAPIPPNPWTFIFG